MAIDLTAVFATHLARNRSPNPNNPEQHRPPDYGVVANLEGSTLDLELTFRRGSAHCCREHGCHVDLFEGRRWDWLRRELAERKVAVPARLELQLVVTIEEGAVFFDLSRPDPTRPGWYAFAPVKAHCYRVSISEAPIRGKSGVETDQPNA
jgi:hypothetical protein